MNWTFASVIPAGFLGFLCFGLLIVSAAAYAVVRWFRWGQNPDKSIELQWRGALAALGFALSTISLFAAVALWIHALFTGGFPFYHPVLLWVLRVGFWTIVTGFLLGLLGKGKLRFPTIVCSIACFLVWLSEAMAQ